jgi:ubiquinone/menaquinone biosynthesis C-methylase UbiE
MDYSEKQKIEQTTFNTLVHQKWDGKSLLVDKDKPPFAFYSGDLLDGAKKVLGDVAGKRILEIGCGNGELSIWLSKNGADAYGLDISDESIAIAEQRIAANGLISNIHFIACPAEHVPYENDFFDIVFINVSLHHLDIDVALKELRRVLKPKGKLVAIEPLAFSKTIQNIRASKLFTKLYPIRQETVTERILLMDDLKHIGTLYENTTYVPYRVFSPFIFKVKPLFNFLARRCYPSVNDFEQQKQRLIRALQQSDERILKALPFLKTFSRYVVIAATKA